MGNKGIKKRRLSRSVRRAQRVAALQVLLKAPIEGPAEESADDSSCSSYGMAEWGPPIDWGLYMYDKDTMTDGWRCVTPRYDLHVFLDVSQQHWPRWCMEVECQRKEALAAVGRNPSMLTIDALAGLERLLPQMLKVIELQQLINDTFKF